MPTLESIAHRTNALESIRGVVQTMKMMSAVNVPPYERAAASIATFHETVLAGLQVVLRDIEAPSSRAVRRGVADIAIVFGSDHGLCGAFNEDIAGFAQATLSDGPPAVMAIGARADQALEAIGLTPRESFMTPATADGLGRLASAVLVALDRIVAGRDGVRVMTFHNRRAPGVSHEPTVRQLLPVDAEFLTALKRKRWESRTLPTYRMDPAALFAALIRQHLFVSVFLAAAESLAAENTARLARMQQAEHAIEDRLEELTAAYRSARQTQITDELMDVIAGFEAMSQRADDEGQAAE